MSAPSVDFVAHWDDSFQSDCYNTSTISKKLALALDGVPGEAITERLQQLRTRTRLLSDEDIQSFNNRYRQSLPEDSSAMNYPLEELAMESKATYGALALVEAKSIDGGEQPLSVKQREDRLEEKMRTEMPELWMALVVRRRRMVLNGQNGSILRSLIHLTNIVSVAVLAVAGNKGAPRFEMLEALDKSSDEISWMDHVLKYANAKPTEEASDSKRGSNNVAVVRGALGGNSQEPNRHKLSPTRKHLPMMLQGKAIGAQHDTGAEGSNFITSKLAEYLKLHIRTKESDRKSFSMGTGKVRRAIGRVKAWCAFAKESGTKMKCWFYVLPKLASPLIMGSQFLRDTRTMSHFTHRLEDQPSCTPFAPMVNLISSTQQAKRRLVAFIDDRQTYINADSGSHLDLVSSAYTKKYGYKVDRRRECRKRIRLADATTAETIGQVKVELMLHDGSTYLKTFDVLPGLTSEVLIGEDTLAELKIFTEHESSFIDVLGGERHFELSILSYLGRVNEFLVRKLNRSYRRSQYQYQCELSFSLSPVFWY